MKLKLMLAAGLMSLGLFVGFAATPAEASPPCDYCLDRLDACLESATTSAQEAACFSQFRQCRIDWCQ